MDINTLRAISTLALFLAFIGICIVVYSQQRKAFYEQAAELPFADDDQAWATAKSGDPL